MHFEPALALCQFSVGGFLLAAQFWEEENIILYRKSSSGQASPDEMDLSLPYNSGPTTWKNQLVCLGGEEMSLG